MFALEVKNLTKKYPAFTLDHASFRVGTGKITGLVGRNGAGKTTILKSILGLISSAGEVEICSLPFRTREREAKSLVGYAGGGFRFYPQKKVGTVAKAISCLYENWDRNRFFTLLKNFSISPEKRVCELSEGMKAKLFVAIALSHGAKLLVLDEPTSGLDPVSREEFCDLLLEVVEREGVSVLFSTHITGDLERIADDVIYLCEGKILFRAPMEELLKRYRVALFQSEAEAKEANAIGIKRAKAGYRGLLEGGTRGEVASLDEIIVHLEAAYRQEQGRVSYDF